jgi:hypothetical protein
MLYSIYQPNAVPNINSIKQNINIAKDKVKYINTTPIL